MKAFVTGVAGFIGSHLACQLLAQGHKVVGVDAFTDAYDPKIKRENVQPALANPRFELVEGDLLALDLPALMVDCDVAFHLAAQAGVRGGWGPGLALYVQRNMLTTQRLLEAARIVSIQKVVLASSSSVYGEAACLPVAETDPCQPLSPYAITKLAAEQLGLAYRQRYGLPLVALRYFAVYGPRQRPDMAFSRFIAGLCEGEPLPVYGDGGQSRDFTYVDDVVDATIRAARCPVEGEVINIGSGRSSSVLEVVARLEALLGHRACINWLPEAPGEPRHTRANIAKAAALLEYSPQVDLAQGLANQLAWATRTVPLDPLAPATMRY
jgi:nucleoside-diphosphate-sugar epimerase